MRRRSATFLVAVLTGGLLIAACGGDDDSMTAGSSSLASSQDDDCSEPDVDCGEGFSCGERLPAPTNSSILEVTLSDPTVTRVSDPGQGVTDARVLQATATVTNQSDATARLAFKYALGWLASADSLRVVSGGIGGHELGLIPVDIPPGQRYQPARPEFSSDQLENVNVALDAEHTCDGNDLASGDYVLMVWIMRVEQGGPDDNGVTTETSAEHIYSLFDVTIP